MIIISIQRNSEKNNKYQYYAKKGNSQIDERIFRFCTE
jgi:hypothetical protein